MFLPQNMTKDEKTLAASIARQVLAKEPDATPERVQQLRHQAEEIAAEQIHAARGAALGESEPVPLEDDQPGSLFRQLSGTNLEYHIQSEWEYQESERVYREAVESGEIQPGDPHELADKISSGEIDIGDPPEDLVRLMVEQQGS